MRQDGACLKDLMDLRYRMLKHKNKKMLYRLFLLVLMDSLIITLSGPMAIYIRYNLLFEPGAITFIEHIFQ